MNRISRVGVVVPAHDEQDLIGACLDALSEAVHHPGLRGVGVEVLVVLDDCGDESARHCRTRAVPTLAVRERNVGRARLRGFAHLISRASVGAAQAHPRAVWLASTDADSRVSPDWIMTQVELACDGADAVFGVVDIDDWDGFPAPAQRRFLRHYRGAEPADPGLHRHAHGANLGVRLDAYNRVGGFPPLSVGEDNALSVNLHRHPDLRVLHTTAVRVTTSARRDSRVEGGFAHVLSGFE
ncbi:glycosyltransferase [Frankia gtarii]|uniref:glycosyltransferase n=1 Tax=Frankia gtarii TaxID=2950102 RepID=UPI0021BFD023|nr:glycosyltransferase [Frankia gtarii]